MVEYIVELTTKNTSTMEKIKTISAAEIKIKRNISGEAIMIIAIAASLAKPITTLIASAVKEKQATIRSQRLKIGKGTMTFESFSSEEIIEIAKALEKKSSA